MSVFNNKISWLSLCFCVLFAIVYILPDRQWNKEKNVIWSDVISYYAYLPATFIFHDLKLEKQETLKKGIFWPETLPGGKKVIKTSMGLSILYFPFFFTAHSLAKIIGLEAYGYSPVYKIGLLLSSLFFFFIGLFFLRKILKNYFSEAITAITILAIAIGTNLFYYTTIQATMSHVYSFALFNIFIWLTIKWHKSKKLKQLIMLGALGGLITLVRPSNIIIFLFFFLFGIYSKESLIQKVRYIFSHLHWFIFMGIAFIVVWIPQLLYWKYVTGDFFFYSYTSERFFFNNPHIINGLFSYRNGWLVYTPIMVFALSGIPFLLKKQKEFFWPVLLFTGLNIYIIFSWWCWWYGGSYGMRALVDMYGMLAIPMALFFSKAQNYRKYIFFSLLIFSSVMVAQNLFHIEKFRTGAIHWDSMTKDAYWHKYWHKHPRNGYWELLEEPDYEKARQGIEGVSKKNK